MSLTLLVSLVAGSIGAPAPVNSDKVLLYGSCFDSDGQHVVGRTQSKRLAVWDARTGRLIRILKGHRDPIYLARISPDGKSVLGQSLDSRTDWATWGVAEKGPRDRSMRLWDIRSGKVVWRISDGFFDAFSRDGRRVYGVASKVSPNVEKPRLACWDLRTGAPVFTMPTFAPRGFLSNIAEESADGRRLLYSDPSGATVFDLESRKKLSHIESTRPMGTPPAAFVGSGDRFFFAGPPSDKGAIALFSVPEGKVVDRAAFPNGSLPLVLGWLPKSEGFVAFNDGRWFSYRKGEGLVDRGEAPVAPDEIVVGPDERSFAAWKVNARGDTRTFKTEAYDAATCVKRWERPGLAVKCLPTGELVVENGDSVSFVDIASGEVKRTIRLGGFFDKRG